MCSKDHAPNRFVMDDDLPFSISVRGRAIVLKRGAVVDKDLVRMLNDLIGAPEDVAVVRGA